jgi:hypothetical protein
MTERIVHGVVECGAGEHHAVDERDGEADGCALDDTEHATGSGAVPIDVITFAPLECRGDEGLAVDAVSDVGDGHRVEDGIDGRAVVGPTLGQTADAGTVAGWLAIRHSTYFPGW